MGALVLLQMIRPLELEDSETPQQSQCQGHGTGPALKRQSKPPDLLLFSNFQLFPFGCYYRLFFLRFNWKSCQAKTSFQVMKVDARVAFQLPTWWCLRLIQKPGSTFSWSSPPVR
ncbi:hypothetical protein E5288_WYG017173 [Bos mutus]|uniref:Uncharacterized protein n=1 Tax=Bos mutus TaxID=72004 RepID=A0A6B0RFF2_9CETA|nr:hypothetical protein [Bos mutus]